MKIDSYKMDVYGTSGISNLTDFQNGHQNVRKIDLARISAKIDIQGKHDVTSSSMTSKITTELH
jgi:hypothetical protein